MGNVDLGGSLPEQFGKYSILGHLATGGMAEVYVARQAGLQGFEKIVVIKRVRAELERDVETTSFFLDEARLVATLEHPNIAQVYEIGLVNGSYFFVMEYVHGADLRQLLEASLKKKQTLPLADAIYIASHVCSALHYAHDKRDLEGQPLHIIHRDVSPSNVLLSHEGAVKLCDFGIAKAQNRSSETQRGMLKGKYSYMSPEQCRSEPLDRRSDVFSMGTLLYELTTLTRLYKAQNDFETLRAIIDLPPPKPSSRVAGYPPELERIVLRALEKDPAQRYQTAQEMQLDLEAFAREHKLAMSSVNVASLMGGLFEKRLEAWARAQKQGKDLGEYLLDTAQRPSGALPAFLPVGSDTAASPDGPTDAMEITPGALARDRKSSERVRPARGSQKFDALETEPSAAPRPKRRRRPSSAWLVFALLAGLVGTGATIAGRMSADGAGGEARTALQADAEKIGSVFDDATHSAHLKAAGIASTPMLREAISTDAATMKDIVTNEYVISPGKGEEIEIFQLRGDKLISLVRLPVGAPPLAPLKGGETRVEIAGGRAMVVAGATIEGSKAALAGVLAIATPVDLSTVRRGLEAHAVGASITGFGEPIVVVDGHDPARTPLKLALPAGDWNKSNATLVASPLAHASPVADYLPAARYSGFGLAGLLLAIYAFSLFRRDVSSA